MIFYDVVVTFSMTLFIIKFANIVIPTYFMSPTFGIFCVLTLCDETLSQIIKIWMEKHLVSDNNNCSIMNL